MRIIKNLIQDIDKNIILMGDLNMTPVSKRFISFHKNYKNKLQTNNIKTTINFD